MPTTTITDKFCARIRPPQAARVEYFDRNLPGFGLRVTDKGGKTFSVLYRVNSVKRRLTLGPYTGAGSLKTARDRARKALEAAAEGRDPAAEKAEGRRSADTVERVVEDYWKRHLATLKDGGRVRSILERELVGRWRHRRIGQITRRDLIQVIDEVVDRGTPGAADKVRAWAAALMSWALQRDLIEHNPAARLRRPHTPRLRSRVLSDGEIRGIWIAAEAVGYPFGPLLHLLVLTGQRRGEVRTMRWEDLDLGERVWTLPDTKSSRPHLVPLAERASAILESLPKVGAFVFSTRRARAFSAFERCKQRLDRASGVEGWILHDIRRTVRTRLARLGFEKHICDRTLGHLPADISRNYDFWEYLPQKRAALAAWARELDRIIKGGAAKVVGIR